jgi:hypothetical protein
METKWLDKKHAAEVLGMSTRSVLAMAADGRIQSKRERDEHTKQMSVKLHAGDVERLRYERAHPEVVGGRAPQSSMQTLQGEQPRTLQTVRKAPPSDDLTAALLRVIAPPAPPVNRWMELDQAAEYSGLSRRLLVHLIHQGRLPAFQDVSIKIDGEKRARTGSSWRVCRRDLDALQGETVKLSSVAG